MTARTILAAVDGSACSLRAARTAAELAKKLGAGVELVHVLAPVLVPAGLYAATEGRFVAQIRDGAKAMLARTAGRVRKQGVDVATRLESGEPAAVIARRAKRRDVEMVVIGSRGLGLAGRLFLGSVSTRVVHHCPKPVLVVR